MSLWLVNAIAVSLIFIPQLAIIGNELNDDPTAGFDPDSWNAIFIPIYIGIGLYTLVTIALIVHAFGGCCNSTGDAKQADDDARQQDDNDNDVKEKPVRGGRKPTVAAAYPLGRTTATPGFADFGNVEDRVSGTPSAQFNSKERLTRLVDCGVRLLFTGLVLAAVIVLAETLEHAPHKRNWTAFFTLVYIVLGFYLFVLIMGAIQTYIIDQSPAGKASGAATLFGGVLCCFRNSSVELAEEADEEMEDNSHTAVARQHRYAHRAEFQERPCVYICAPYAVNNWTMYILAFLAWTVPIALLWSSIVLMKFLNEHRPSAPTPEVESLELMAPTRAFNGRQHHIATYAPRIKAPADLYAAAMRLHNGDGRDENGIDLLDVTLPLIVAISILILHLPCLLLKCLCTQSRAIDWLLGFIYAAWLAFWLWFLIELADTDNGHPDDFQELFTPLYILFGITIVLGIVGFLCLPKSYKMSREYVSEWGLMVYKK
jgi:hypothetical protein